jgi:leucyl/phenylalanyl-tRNA--protein transferase
MPVFRLEPEPIFPSPYLAEPDGLLALGGDLSTDRLLAAYRQGIFPWYEAGGPILWWSPDPRLVLFCDELHISRRLERTIRQGRFETRYDTAFAEVIRACANTPRTHEDGTWITCEMEEAYIRLHQLGHAHCMESWRCGKLVGGIYGVRVGRCFCGESMFHRETDASKVALAALVRRLQAEGVNVIDCQVASEHLKSLGAREIPRRRFLELLKAAQVPDR